MTAITALVASLATIGASNPSQQGGVTGWLLHFHGPVVYVLVGFLAFAEAGLMVGFFIPGETAVVVGGVLAGLHRVNLAVLIVVVVVCAIVGDSCGFEIGKRSGPWLLQRRPLKGNAAVRRTMGMLEHYGGPAVFIGRFVAFARAIIPGLAGMSGLPYPVFLLFNATGGLIWGVGYTLLGFVVGLSFQRILAQVGMWSLVVLAAVVVLAVGVRFGLKRRERRRLAAEMSDDMSGDDRTPREDRPAGDGMSPAADGQGSDG